MISKQEALIHQMIDLEIKLENFKSWCSFNGVSNADRRHAQQLEIRIECLARRSKCLDR